MKSSQRGECERPWIFRSVLVGMEFGFMWAPAEDGLYKVIPR